MSSSSTAASPPTADPLTFRYRPDRRQPLTRQQAQQVVATLYNKPYTTISLGGCAVRDGAAVVIGEALMHLAEKKCVRNVDFSDCIGSLSEEEALRSLHSLSHAIGQWKGLRSVNLSHNALGSLGISQCGAMLEKQQDLQELRLEHAGLAAESARLIQSYLGVRPATRLRSLQIHANSLDSAGTIYFAEIVGKSPNIQCLRLSSVNAGANALARVAFALESKTCLRELDLSDNLLDSAAATALANSLVALPHLQRLILKDLDMKDAALKALLKPFVDAEHKPPLTHLALADNELSPAVAPVLESLLFAYSHTLTYLDLSHNELGPATAQSLTDALADAHRAGKKIALKTLLLAKTKIPGIPILRLTRELVALPGFERLDILRNPIPKVVYDCIVGALGPSAVLYNVAVVPNEGEESSTTSSQVDEEQLQEAMQEFADITSVMIPSTPRSSELLSPFSEQSSSQSRSAVSRLRTLFSEQGSENGSEQTSSRVPGTVEETSTSTRTAPPRSFEDDSGAREDNSETNAPSSSPQTLPVNGATMTSSTLSTARNVLQEPGAIPVASVANRIVTSAEQPESAKKLKTSLASFRRAFTNLSSEFGPPVSSPLVAENRIAYLGDMGNASNNVGDYLLAGELSRDGARKQSALGALVNILGALLIGAFLVILVLAIVQSLEESTFAYRAV
ncbi:unnamed protein product [Chondrus crispus]|uniref:Uncharacterized protein n=1 Tax=Chondrus crispus TaxID=2769 RepID=R7QAI2_CHOCR|nr:unnamed protein product [Chondrus crispus]CDF35059.1 unnamed protein product [Chondrus crispus]|eukprot:XP_005714878.1 unnamed protein product [Chondrus crispus]